MFLPNTGAHSVSVSSATMSASASFRSNPATEVPIHNLGLERSKEKVKHLFEHIDLSISSYDTAWVAMVPLPSSRQVPCFPKCLNWILENQLHNGSWGLSHRHSLLVKDALSSTLACVLALKQWGIGETQINKGLDYIGSNLASIRDDNQLSPIGFDIIFSGLIEYADRLNLNLPLESADRDGILQKRDVELRSYHGGDLESGRAYWAYISEGIREFQDWEMVMKYQRKNGSLFNSPSATAAAFCHTRDDGCLSYLHAVLEKFGSSVPTVYPFNIYARLCMVDSIESLGIERHFWKEIKTALDDTYRSWIQGDEDIFLDAATCAMAFRLLRVHGYDISSDPLTRFSEENVFSSPSGCLEDITALLELFKSSQVMLHPEETILEEQNRLTKHFLKENVSNGSSSLDVFGGYVRQKVDDALQFPFHANLERVALRRNIKSYVVDSTRVLKTSFRSSNIANKDVLKLAVEEFNSCQLLYHEELKYLERWVEEYRLDRLKFARQKLTYCYFSAAATICSPELFDARISWAKNGVLTTVVDDFFDVGGSKEELENLIQLIEKFDSTAGIHCHSEVVKIIYSALHDSIAEIGNKAFSLQGHDVTGHVIDIWLDLLRSMLQEALWSRNKTMPSIEEYMKNGYVSFALGPIILPTLYLVGPRLSLEVAKGPETSHLFELVSTCGRLLNDVQGFKRESTQGKLNALSLHMIHGNAACTEDIVEEIKSIVHDRRRELLRSVLQEKGSIVPRACKDLFWNMCKILHLFYMKDDGFTSHEMFDVVTSVVGDPILRDDV
uniref:ent-kaurene synthase n=1 Tax=Aquilaria sinensis TaxID=210372 RepID=A0A8E8ARH6_9ROSI|nr:terpene synthase 22 [Aquilaria sinensis]WBO38706.1 terpene synthase 35 [Aquilaria agallochum]